MDQQNLTILLYFLALLCAILTAFVVDLRIKVLRFKQKNYFLKRDRDRYAETIYASKDGYFAFIYPDERINDPRRGITERCSRRLAVMLDLKNGRNASFDDVLDSFYKEDARKLQKYLSLMQEDGIAFEDTFQMKSIKKNMRIFGSRINGSDGNLYCDMLWFRDLSAEQIKIENLQNSIDKKKRQLAVFQDLFDHLGLPLYLRNENLDVMASNKAYQAISKDSESKESLILKGLGDQALQTNQPQHRKLQSVVGGQVRYFEAVETPFHNDQTLDKIGTVGYLTDITAFEDVKRDFKTHQNAHLSVLASLGSAIAIFDTRANLVFCNKAFKDMWHIDSEAEEKKLSYPDFLNILRTKRMLPEVSDFKAYKMQEEKLFSSLIETKENLIHLPDGRTIRRLVSPHPNGLIFAYEDVSDKLAAERMIHELMSVEQNILENVQDAILIFSQDERLRYFNESYIKLFNASRIKLQNLPSAMEVFDMQKTYFSKVEHWDNLTKHMKKHIFEICDDFQLQRDDGSVLYVKPSILADESVMVRYLEK